MRQFANDEPPQPEFDDLDDEELSYEDFEDDLSWADEMEILDLDALDDDTTPDDGPTLEDAAETPPDSLDDALEPPSPAGDAAPALDDAPPADEAQEEAAPLSAALADQAEDEPDMPVVQAEADTEAEPAPDEEEPDEIAVEGGEPAAEVESLPADEPAPALDTAPEVAPEPETHEAQETPPEAATAEPSAPEPEPESAGDIPEPASAEGTSVEAEATAAEAIAVAPVVDDSADEEAPESAVPAEAAAPSDSAGSEQPEPEPPPDQLFCAILSLAPELGSQVLQLRESGDVTDMPSPGIALTPAFRTTDWPAVERAVSNWARNHLPIQLETTGIQAEVVGEQHYVAAWTLQPEEELQEAQFALMRALAPLIAPESDIPGTASMFNVRVTIGDRVPPRSYPHLVAQMQAEFTPFVWHAESVQLVRMLPEIAPGQWEIANAFD
jgi:hypothetical protein